MRILLAHAVNQKWYIHHLDVETALLNSEIDGEVYVSLPKISCMGTKVPEGYAWQLRKSLYWLKKSPHLRNKTFDKLARGIRWILSVNDKCLYLIKESSGRVMMTMGLYVDDFIISGEKKSIFTMVEKFNQKLNIKSIGMSNYILGMHVEYDKFNYIIINQKQYSIKILEEYGMLKCNPSSIPMQPRSKINDDAKLVFNEITKIREVIRSLMYLACCTRPDISFPVCLLSEKMSVPTEGNLLLVKRILKVHQG
jgi:Reverse transcriptase (RNA-dependent DNA polymerase)